jgi:hypothetical protein
MEFVCSGIRDQRHLCEMTFGRELYNELECVKSVNEANLRSGIVFIDFQFDFVC